MPLNVPHQALQTAREYISLGRHHCYAGTSRIECTKNGRCANAHSWRQRQSKVHSCMTDHVPQQQDSASRRTRPRGSKMAGKMVGIGDSSDVPCFPLQAPVLGLCLGFRGSNAGSLLGVLGTYSDRTDLARFYSAYQHTVRCVSLCYSGRSSVHLLEISSRRFAVVSGTTTRCQKMLPSSFRGEMGRLLYPSSGNCGLHTIYPPTRRHNCAGLLWTRFE
jgi:hypothetical protein